MFKKILWMFSGRCTECGGDLIYRGIEENSGVETFECIDCEAFYDRAIGW